jgi:hypothetical protein
METNDVSSRLDHSQTSEGSGHDCGIAHIPHGDEWSTTPNLRRTATMRKLIFVCAIFVNAFLLFLLQPMFGKMVLPHVGGSAAVWTTCMLFFQTALLVGYLYAHALASRLAARAQLVIHLGLIAAAALTLPVSVPKSWTPTDPSSPIGPVLALLAMRIGPVFVLLAAGSPLLQHWFARATGPTSDPYRLYVASNLGSAAALLAYPFGIEPWLTVHTQAGVWTAGFVTLMALLFACGLLARGTNPTTKPIDRAATLSWQQRLRWVALAAAPSSLLLGVTTHITTDLAPIPLLWVVPLVLYLTTFVIAFGDWRTFPTRWVVASWPYAALAVVVVLFFDSEIPGPAGYALHVVTFFVSALACHAVLAASRPAPARLTEFYIWLSVGGALGGFFNVVIAPQVFTGTYEYPLALVAAVALLPATAVGRRWIDVAVPATLGGALLVGAPVASSATGNAKLTTVGMLLVVGAVATFASRTRPLRFALSMAAILGVGLFLLSRNEDTRLAVRSFYGVYRVVDDSSTGHRALYSGTTVHGAEAFSDSGREPLTYHHRDGPVGDVFAARSWRPGPWRVAVVGLGAGAMAAYAQPGESWTFFEIDPLVARVASDRRFFRFLSNARTTPRIVLGDARLSLEREPSAAFDVLFIDAFTSDAIPTHLLTREALTLYRSRLEPDGMIAWHISNRYLDLRPVLDGLARNAGISSFIREDVGIKDSTSGRFSSTWVVMTAGAKTAGAISANKRWAQFGRRSRSLLWTDDFSNVLGVLR